MVEIIHANSTGLGFAALSNIIGGAGQGVQSYQQAQAQRRAQELQDRKMGLAERELQIREQMAQQQAQAFQAQFQDRQQQQDSRGAASEFSGKLATGAFNEKPKQALADVGAYAAYRAMGIPKALPGTIMDLKPGIDYQDPFQDPVMLKLFMDTQGQDRETLVGLLQERQQRAIQQVGVQRFASRLQGAVQSGLIDEGSATVLAQHAQQDPIGAIELLEEGIKEKSEARGRTQSIQMLHQKATQDILSFGEFAPGELHSALGVIESALADPTVKPSELRKLWLDSMTQVSEQMENLGQSMPQRSLGAQMQPGGQLGDGTGMDDDAPDDLKALFDSGNELNADRPEGMPKPRAEPKAKEKTHEGDAEAALISNLERMLAGSTDRAKKRAIQQAMVEVKSMFRNAATYSEVVDFLKAAFSDSGATESSSYMPKQLSNQGATWRQR